MKCFRLEIVGEDRALQEDGEFEQNRSTFLIASEIWNLVLRSANISGTTTVLTNRVEIKCGACDSYMLPAGAFIEFVQKTGILEKGDEYLDEIVRENLWHIFKSLVETKFNNEDAFWKYWRDGGGEHHLLKEQNGELVFDEITGLPLGLAYGDVAVKTSNDCPSCASLFLRD